MQLGIFVGGRSIRMGRPKGLLEHKGQTLLARALDLAAAIDAEPVLVGDATPYARITGPRRCADEGAGPLGGLLALLRHGPALALACDMPFVEAEHLRALLAAPPAIAVLARSGDVFEPFPARYAPQLCGHIERQLEEGRRSFQSLFRSLPAGMLLHVSLPPSATIDWDSPEDLLTKT